MSSDSIADSVKEVVKERLRNPLWGYIVLSWCGFNWQNLAILFMSKSSVITRIALITNTENFYIWSLAAPVVVGLLLSIVSPYINHALSKTKRYIEKQEREGVKKSLLAEYELIKETAREKVLARNTERLEQAKNDMEFEGVQVKIDSLKQEIDKKKVELNHIYEEIRNKEQELQVNIRLNNQRVSDVVIENNKRIEEERRKTEGAIEEYWRWVEKTAELLIAIDGFVRIDNSTSHSEFRKNISNIVAKEALTASIQAIKEKQNNKKLDIIKSSELPELPESQT